jgi:hypothetical protein
MNIEKLKIDVKKLPLVIELYVNGIKKNYVIKTNKEKTGIFLNKIEQY